MTALLALPGQVVTRMPDLAGCILERDEFPADRGILITDTKIDEFGINLGETGPRPGYA